jgi:hypothetical protein
VCVIYAWGLDCCKKKKGQIKKRQIIMKKDLLHELHARIREKL